MLLTSTRSGRLLSLVQRLVQGELGKASTAAVYAAHAAHPQAPSCSEAQPCCVASNTAVHNRSLHCLSIHNNYASDLLSLVSRTSITASPSAHSSSSHALQPLRDMATTSHINHDSDTPNRIRSWSTRMSSAQFKQTTAGHGGSTGGDDQDANVHRITEEELEEAKLFISDVPIGDVSDKDVNKYVYCGPEVMPPEAYNEWHQDPLALQEGMRPVKGGCQGMQDEYKMTRVQWLLYRPFIHELLHELANPSRTLIKLDGPAGCGKSIALVMAVAWARANNFFVLYVPNAFKLLYDSRFLVRDADGLLDTPDTAKQLLKSMYDAHAMQLKELATQADDEAVRTQAARMLQLMEEGLASEEFDVPVDAFMEILSIMREFEGMPVLIAIDDYNSLWLKTEYFKPGPSGEDEDMVDVPPEEVRIANALRVLSGPPPARGVFIGAMSHSARVSPKLRIPLQKTQDYLVTYEDGTQEEETQVVGATAYCPPFSYTEFLVMACHYSETVMSLFSRDRTDPEVDVIFDRAYQLMQGDARAFRTTVIWEMNNVQLGSYQGEDGKAIE